MEPERAFAYDRILYPSYLHSQTHPDRLAVMAKFFGMSPAPVERCRVLELGCGTGSTLLAFALGLPQSEFVGVDLGERQIAAGKETASAVGIENLKLIHGDLMDVERKELGQFDYLIAHGVYSWVPEHVRERVLEICREMLAPKGVGFISYNAYPGCHIRQMTREIMRFHTRGLDEPAEKVEQGQAMMKFVAEGAAEGKLYKSIYEAELALLLDRNPENIFHDDLADVNQPFYLYEFVESLARHELKYISDVQYFSTRDLAYRPEVVEALTSMGDNVEMREQYLDFLNCRRFRQSLICHAEVELRRSPSPEILDAIRLASRVKPVSTEPELATRKLEEFAGPKAQQHLEIDHPLAKAALFYLGSIWPRSADFLQIILSAADLIASETGAPFEATETDTAALREVMLRIFGSGLLEFRTTDPSYAERPGERPATSPLARWQAARGETVFNLRYESLDIDDPLGRRLITTADGTRDREAICEALIEFVRSEEFEADNDTRERLAAEIPRDLDKQIEKLADLALLVQQQK